MVTRSRYLYTRGASQANSPCWMTSLVALRDRTSALPRIPRLSSRGSPFLTTTWLRYMA